MNLKDAVVVITGSARGLGKAMAVAFAERGAKVGLADVLAGELDATASELKAAGTKVYAQVTDVTKAEDVERLVASAEQELGPIDIFINDAATFSVIGPVWEVDHEKWFRDIRVNLYGTFLGCRAVAGRMAERKSGYILNVVSAGGVGDPHPYSTSYACSKAGSMRLTEGLAKELAEYGVKVFAVAPPAVLTDMTKFIMDDEGGKKWRPNFKDIFAKGNAKSPQVVVDLVLGLVSGKVDALTGRYFLTNRSVDEMSANESEILEKDLMTLRIRS